MIGLCRKCFSGSRICIDNVILNLLPDIGICNRIRPMLGKLLGMRIGRRVFLRKGSFYGNVRHISIGDYSGANREVFFDAFDHIQIGSNVGIGFKVTFVTSYHNYQSSVRTGEIESGSITIEDGVWIGSQVTIGPGVVIGSGSVISAGSVVMRSIPPQSLVAGNPARVIRQLQP